MPSLADQIRAANRRKRRRRTALVGVVALAASVVALRISAQPVEPTPPVTTQSAAAPTAPTTSRPTGLHPGLVAAFSRAQASAAAAGHRLTITSGFRTPEEQAAMLEAAIAERGSRQEALWWVFPPERSMHVKGLAIDVADGPAADWLNKNGARFGLCQTLAWEWWHFEWRQRWQDSRTCPPRAKVPNHAPTG